MKRSQIILLAVVAIADLAFIWWHFARHKPHHPAPDAGSTVAFRAAFISASPDAAGPGATAGAAAPDPTGSPLAAQLNAPDGDGMQDVRTLHALLRQYVRMLHDRQGPPIGDDIDLARVLTGHNPLDIVFIPPGNPALSADGHLRDRWGTPYFIHPIGYGSFEVRSAGPDRKLFTDDDLVDGPGGGGSPPHTEIPDATPGQ